MMSKIAALQYMTQLRMKNRLQLDVWGNSAVEDTNTGYNVKKSQKLCLESQNAWNKSLTSEPVMESLKKYLQPMTCPRVPKLPMNMMVATKITAEPATLIERKKLNSVYSIKPFNPISYTLSKQTPVKGIGTTKPSVKTLTETFTHLRDLRREGSSNKGTSTTINKKKGLWV